ncbi:nuclear pore complex protein Nup153 isoform X1 [Rhincodon typus]|uniref:nuclear pore complex protein Nup153 isoform X1 n=1 Tax=Rhincodon typus TaxID=259920 RepID=UPI00202EF35D|nr:nuclear pore complex protein Nup153 isoform X1 [Rhincodon typus]
MAAATGGGGGKIRNKRHHIISKPYAKNQGIIGRVTNTVKNIVPGWLQKYFGKTSKTEPAEAGGSLNNHENDPVLVNETPPFDNGKHQPAPTTSRTAVSTPSSKSALNFSEMLLLRPALSRAHINCAALDTPAHDCQPSTSSSFPIGNSGFSLVKEIKDSGSLHEDDNISTTSGFSSRASDKDVITSRNASLPPLWSPEGERFHSAPQQPAVSLKRPSFNLSAFGSSPPSFISTSLLNSSQLGDSPFYPGKTTYGGAAAAAVGRASQPRSTPYQVPIRRQMKAKPASSPSYGVTSATARRILQSLEKMSSPLADAKRIPSTVTSPLSMSLEKSTIDATGWQSKMRKLEAQGPPVQKLQTPVIVSGAINRSMFFKPSLTPGGQSNRHIDRTENQNNRVREKSPIPEISLQATKSDSCSYQVIGSRATNGLTSGGAGGKMKRDKGHYSSRSAQEVKALAPELPEVSLPVKNTKLPTFNFGSPSTTLSPVISTVTQSFPDKVVVSSPNNAAFTFSTPNIKATEANLQPISVSTGFTFSEPIDKSVPFVFVSARPSINAAKCISLPSISTPMNERKGEECDGLLKPAKTLKQGSVLDILKGPEFTLPSSSTQCVTKSLDITPATVKPLPPTTEKNSSSIESSSTLGFGDKFKPAEGSWQCGSCFVQNKITDSKCVACQTSKIVLPMQTDNESANRDKPTCKETPVSFADKFRPALGTWSCDICLVQNKSEAVKCAACDSPKAGTGVKSALTLPAVIESTRNRESNPSSSNSVGLGLADQFKKPEGVWDCAVCLLENKAEDSKCVACQSAKPGIVPVVANTTASTPTEGILGFGDKFKKPTGSWDCETCFVQNSSNITRCVACKTEKTGSKIEPKGLSSSVLSTVASPFSIGIQPSTVDSSQSKDGATGFKFGNQGGFKFGTSDSASSTSAFGGLKFEVAGGFKFGLTSTEKISEENKKDNSKGTSGGFKFEVAAFGNNPTSTKFASDTSQQSKKSDVAPGGFKFDTSGTFKPEDKGTASGFKFGTEEKKETSVVQFQLDKAEERKDGANVNAVLLEKAVDQEPVAAKAFVFGKPDEKQNSLCSTPIAFGKRKDVEPQPQSELTFKKPEQTKESASLSDTSKAEPKTGFTFNLVKPVEKPEATETAQQGFVFGATVNTSEQGITKPAFSLFGNSSSMSTAANAAGSAPPSIFGNSASATNPPFLFGQASTTAGSANLGSCSESTVAATKPFLFGSQDIKPAVSNSSTGTSVAFPFGSTPSSSTATSSVFTFGASTTTSSSTGGSSNSIFGFGSSSTAAVNPPAFGNVQTPVPLFGQSSSQPPTAFVSAGAPTFAFSTGCQQPAFGPQSTSSQPSLFGGQLPNQQPTFGSTSSTSSNAFQFGNSGHSFNFNATNSSNEVFKFGSASTGATQQPGSTGGFQFNPSPGFAVGVSSTNPFSTTSSGRSTVTGRKIKTAVRRKK